MDMKKLIGGGLILVIALLLFNKMQIREEGPPPNPHLLSLIDDYESYLLKSKKSHNIPGLAVAIIKDSSIVYLRGMGLRNVNYPDTIDINTVFRIGSLSKGFAALLAGKLAEEGHFSLQDEVVKYMPDFKFRSSKHSNQVKIKHLLSHTSGLPYHTYTNLIEHGKPIDYIVNQFKKVKPISRPGEVYSYQNASFSAIDLLIQKTTDSDYAQQLQAEFLDPLQMKNTSYSLASIKENKNHATPHQGGGSLWNPVNLSSKYYNAIPAGGINASIKDMAIWMQALLGQKENVLSKKVLSRIFTPQVNTPIRSRYFSKWPKVKSAWYAHGWRVLDYGKETIVYHGGFVNSFRAELAINPKEQLGICVLTNAPSGFAKECIPEFLDRYEVLKDSINLWGMKFEEKMDQ